MRKYLYGLCLLLAIVIAINIHTATIVPNSGSRTDVFVPNLIAFAFVVSPIVFDYLIHNRSASKGYRGILANLALTTSGLMAGVTSIVVAGFVLIALPGMLLGIW